MKATLSLALLGALVLAPDAFSQEPLTQEQYRARRAEKLDKEFLQKADWILDYDEARAEAARQGKWIFTYFTRTYQP